MNALLPFQRNQLEHLGYYTETLPLGSRDSYIDVDRNELFVTYFNGDSEWVNAYEIGYGCLIEDVRGY